MSTPKLKDFVIGDVFEKIDTKKLPWKANDLPTTPDDVHTMPLLTAGVENQGLARYAKPSDDMTVLKGVISVSANGANTGAMFYQPEPFTVLQDAYAIRCKDRDLTEAQSLYMISCLQKPLRNGNFDWSNKAGWNRIKDLTFKLPVVKKIVPDWDALVNAITHTHTPDGGVDMSKIDTTGWKEFRLADAFQVEYGNKFDKNKMTYTNPQINFVSRTANNNGVSDVVDQIPNAKLFPAGSLTLALGGSIGSCFLQEKPFYTGQNVGVIQFSDDVPYEARLFIACVISKKCKALFSTFSNEINKHLKTDLSILLPVKETEEIDYAYMEERVRELEEEHVRELEAYLRVTGLENDKLTEKEKIALTRKQTYKTFTLEELFGLPERGSRLTKEKRQAGEIPLVTAGYEHYGIAEYISNPEQKRFKGDCLTIDMFGSCFYRDTTFCADDNILVFGCQGLTQNQYLFIASAINRAAHSYDYGKQYRLGSYKQTSIQLPVDENGNLDLDFMDCYISAQKKLAIQSVNAWRKKEIETTTKIVNANNGE